MIKYIRLTGATGSEPFLVPDKLANDIKRQGFRIEDAPYKIRPEWEQYPIVKAIRVAEKRTGLLWPGH